MTKNMDGSKYLRLNARYYAEKASCPKLTLDLDLSSLSENHFKTSNPFLSVQTETIEDVIILQDPQLWG